MKDPLENTYWVEGGALAAGEYPRKWEYSESVERVRAFLEEGFDHFIDLTESGELKSYFPILKDEAHKRGWHVTYERFPIPDQGVPHPREMQRILDAIWSAMEQDRVVYVHCWGGVGRTGTVIGCYLVSKGLTGPEALRKVAARFLTMEKAHRHEGSPETPEQSVSLVLSWEYMDAVWIFPGSWSVKAVRNTWTPTTVKRAEHAIRAIAAGVTLLFWIPAILAKARCCRKPCGMRRTSWGMTCG